MFGYDILRGACVLAFRDNFYNDTVFGCWFYYGQPVVKCLQKTGLQTVYQLRENDNVTDIIHCVLVLPPLPGHEMARALEVGPIRSEIDADTPYSAQLQQLAAYLKQQWLNRSTVGPDRLSVRDSPARTNNVLESFHSPLRQVGYIFQSNSAYSVSNKCLAMWHRYHLAVATSTYSRKAFGLLFMDMVHSMSSKCSVY